MTQDLIPYTWGHVHAHMRPVLICLWLANTNYGLHMNLFFNMEVRSKVTNIVYSSCTFELEFCGSFSLIVETWRLQQSFVCIFGLCAWKK